MHRQSKLMMELKSEEILDYKNMSPQQRLKVAIAHNKIIKELCFIGLTKKGFTKTEISRILNGHKDE